MEGDSIHSSASGLDGQCRLEYSFKYVESGWPGTIVAQREAIAESFEVLLDHGI